MMEIFGSISDWLKLRSLEKSNVSKPAASDTSSEQNALEVPQVSPSSTNIDINDMESNSCPKSPGRKSDVADDNDEKRFSTKLWCRAHRTEILGSLLVVVGVLILFLSLFLARNPQETTQLSGSGGGSDVGDEPPSIDPGLWQDPTLMSPPVTPPPVNLPLPTFVPPTPTPTSLSLFDEIANAIPNPEILRQPDTPQFRAFEWLSNVDERHPDQYVTQRFALATLYFATGGRRTTASWKYCSAVPLTTAETINSFASRCVFEDGRHVCAAIHEYEECPEYYDSFFASSIPENPKKRWLSIAPECDWFGITCDDDGRVAVLNLEGNGLEGTLVHELRLLTSLTSLQLADNNLVGVIPEWSASEQEVQGATNHSRSTGGNLPWPFFDNLQTFDVSKNTLTGSVVLPIGSLYLRTFNMSENPGLEIWMSQRVGLWSDLETLDVSGTTMNGPIPGAIGNWKSLQRLNMSDTKMAGNIPPEIEVMSELVELHLHSNELTGTLPIGLWELSNLEVLRLDHNRFSGTLSTMVGRLTSLVELDLEHSGLTGNLPASLDALQSLERAKFHFNEFSGEVPEGVCDLPNLVELTSDCDRQGNIECSCCTLCCSLQRERCRS